MSRQEIKKSLAKKFGISVNLIDRAGRIKRKCEETFNRCHAGDLTIAQAEKLLGLKSR